MRPLRLTLRSFGCFQQPLDLDFTALRGQQLFLIHGPTGAGKTTLLDAICFALYGESSGAERDGASLRSDFAADSDATEVVLDFSLGYRSYRVRRVPRRSDRGRSEAASLEELTAGASGTVISGSRAVTQHVTELMGFNAEQFRQVVVLPQGRFRELLTSNSTERQKILEVLFQTGRFQDLVFRLKERSARLRGELERDRAVFQQLLEQTGAADLPGLALLRESLTAELQQLLVQSELAEQSWQQAGAALQAGVEAERLHQELALATADLTSLLARREEMGARKISLSQAERAVWVWPALEEESAAATTVTQRQRELNSAREELDGARRLLTLAEQRTQEEVGKEPDREALRVRRRELEQIRLRIRELESREAAVQSALSEVDKRREELQQADTAAMAAETAAQQTREQAELAARAEAELPVAQLQAAEWDRVWNWYQALQSLRPQIEKTQDTLAALQPRLHAAQVQLETASAQRDHAEQAWLTRQAGALAERLQPGSPCPVCGSREHPTPAARPTGPAAPGEVRLAREAEKEAMRTLEQLQRMHSEQESVLSTLQRRQAELQEELGSHAGTARTVLERHRKDANAHVSDLQRRSEPLPRLRQEEQALASAVVSSRTGAAAARLAVADAELQHAALVGARDQVAADLAGAPQAERELDQQLGDLGRQLREMEEALEKRRADEEKRRTKRAELEALVTVRAEELEAALKAAEQRRQQTEVLLAQYEFSDRAAARTAYLDPEKLAHLRAELLDYDRNTAAAEDRRQRATAAATGITRPDLEQLQEQLNVAQERRNQCLETRTRREVELKLLTTAETDLQQRGAALAELEAVQRSAGLVAEVAEGKSINQRRLPFPRWVLAEVLAQVLVLANHHLEGMCQGRFRLERSADLGGRVAGLDLVVFDHFTGTRRDVKTLSGGESFLAALSLALGLAELVRRTSGGVHLETIFVDEGFGSLDSETLEQVMGVLYNLEQGGRLVGVVSHVAEMKASIPTRLEVVRGERGSTAGFVL